jgi:DNA-binding HxlR family transcriptional regulator
MTATASRVKKALPGNRVSGGEPPDPYAAGCPTRMLLDRIGDKWTVLVLGLVSDRPRRFNDMRRGIEGLTQKMLSQTLKALERDGLVTRTVLPTAPVSVEYAITPLGRTLAATLEELQRWARDHIGEVLGAQRRYDEGKPA